MAFESYVRFFSPAFGIALGLISPVMCEPTFALEAKQIVILHSFGPDIKPWSDYAKAIRQQLTRQSPQPLNTYEYSLVTARASDENPESSFVQYLQADFYKRQPDLIVSIGAPAAAFVQRHRHELFPTAPMLLTVVDQTRVKYSTLTDNDAVVAVKIDYLSAFNNILRVLPDTKSILVVTGSSPIEKYWKNEIGRQVASLANQINIEWTDNLSFEELLNRARRLPKHTAIFWELMVVDAQGVQHEEEAALSKLHQVASAPIFSYTDAFFGSNIVGGPHVPVLEAGQKTAEVAMRILAGEKAGDIKVPPVGMGVPKYDWRQLQRWEISENLLPPNSEIYFRDPTTWEHYRWEIIMILATILIQAVFIQRLLYQRHRRWNAENESKRSMSELAHINRQTVTSGMAAAIAHEVNQPLTAILSNAEAAQILLNSEDPDFAELKTIFDEIRDEDQRANEIIRRLRLLTSKKTDEHKPILLNEVVLDALSIGEIQTRIRGIEVRLNLEDTLPPILGDAIQLQQVILNLLVNSIDAIDQNLHSKKNIVVKTEQADNSAIEFSIADSGFGFDPDKLGDLFKPFFTTKPTGMGMGLSIAQMIINSHGGTLWAENNLNGGATVRFRLNALADPKVPNNA